MVLDVLSFAFAMLKRERIENYKKTLIEEWVRLQFLLNHKAHLTHLLMDPEFDQTKLTFPKMILQESKLTLPSKITNLMKPQW